MIASLSLPLLLALADPAPPAPRSAEAILADYVNAIGGAKAWQRHTSLRTKRTVTAPAMKIEGTEERWNTIGNKYLSVTTMEGLGGPLRQGSDGKVFWSEDPINGKRLQEGVEREQARLLATWNAELNLAKIYKKMAPVAPPSGAPQTPLECLEMTPELGPALTFCFDSGTHLPAYMAGRQSSPQGDIPFETWLSEYKTYDGVKIATFERSKAGPAAFEGRLTEVKFDETFAPSLFTLKSSAPAKRAAEAAKGATAAPPP
jgi:hypothetical protein